VTKRRYVSHVVSGLSAVVLFLSLAAKVGSQPEDHPPKSAASDTVPPGEYMTEAGWGNLSISKTKTGTTIFELQSTTDSENGAVCKVKFTKTDKGIDVLADTPKECSGFCGANGGFKGQYLTIPEGCSADEVDKTRSNFKKLYLRKDYKTALVTLQPLLKKCTATLNFIDLGDIRNDVAITQYKFGLYSECIDTLKPYAVDAGRKDSEVTNDWPTNQAVDYLKILKSSRTNIRLCTK
jgi:hypothetical protein